LVARLLWEQDVAGSNPVTPTAKQVSPALTSKPPTQGGFFVLSFSRHAKHTQKGRITRTGNPVCAAFLFLVADESGQGKRLKSFRESTNT
jgi:hypothetical protein